jgi:hypothetical protein
VADPIVDYVERRDGTRLRYPEMWEYLLTRLSVEEAMIVATAAYARGELSTTRAALRQVVDSGHPETAPRAAHNLGVVLQEQGDVAGARAAYQQAIDTGHPVTAAAAQRALDLTE